MVWIDLDKKISRKTFIITIIMLIIVNLPSIIDTWLNLKNQPLETYPILVPTKENTNVNSLHQLKATIAYNGEGSVSYFVNFDAADVNGNKEGIIWGEGYKINGMISKNDGNIEVFGNVTFTNKGEYLITIYYYAGKGSNINEIKSLNQPIPKTYYLNVN